MRVKNIQARNLKGRTFDRKLGTATIIAGPNDTGKTAMIDAVRLALFGRLPGRKTAPAIFELSSATTLAVDAELENGATTIAVTRQWTKKGQSVKGKEEGTDQLPPLPEVLLDANEYFGAGPTKRIDMVFALCDVGELKPIDALEKLIEPAGVKIEKPPGPLKVQVWLDMAIAELADAVQKARAEVKRFDGMSQGITSVALAEKTVDPAAIDKLIAEAREELEKAIGEHARLETVAANVTAKSRRKRELNERIAELNRAIGEFEPDAGGADDDKVAQLQASLANARATYQAELKAWERSATKAGRVAQIDETIAVQEKIAAQGPDAERRRAEIEAAIKALGDIKTASAAQRVRDAAVKVAELAQQQRSLEAARKAEIERIHKLSVQRCCPTCGAKGQEWGEMLDEVLAAKQIEWDGQEAAIGEQYVTATEEQKVAEAAHSAEVTKQAELDRLDRSLAVERQRQRDAHAAGVLIEQLGLEKTNIGPVNTTRPEPPPEIAKLEAEFTAAKEVVTKLQAIDRRRGYQEELDAIGTLDDEAGEAASRAELEIESVRDRIASLEEQRKQAAAQLADAKRLQQAADEKADAVARVEKLTAAQKALAKEREELIERAFHPLLETANRFIAGMIPSPLEFHEGALGRFAGANWVDLSAFGGTFQAAAYAGIQAALCMKSPARIVIVDELGRMDVSNKAKFVANVIDALHANVIDQFIGIDVSPEDWANGPESDALTVITTAAK